MKYPLLKLKQLPLGFKHCSIAIALQYKFNHIENYVETEDEPLKKEYMKYLLKELASTSDSLMTLARAQSVFVNDTYIVLLKDNVDIYKLKDMIHSLLQEVNQLTDSKIALQYSIVDCLVMLEDKEVSFLRSRKAGDDFFESKNYLDSIIDFQPSKKYETMNVLTPFYEYKRKQPSKSSQI